MEETNNIPDFDCEKVQADVREIARQSKDCWTAVTDICKYAGEALPDKVWGEIMKLGDTAQETEYAVQIWFAETAARIPDERKPNTVCVGIYENLETPDPENGVIALMMSFTDVDDPALIMEGEHPAGKIDGFDPSSDLPLPFQSMLYHGAFTRQGDDSKDAFGKFLIECISAAHVEKAIQTCLEVKRFNYNQLLGGMKHLMFGSQQARCIGTIENGEWRSL